MMFLGDARDETKLDFRCELRISAERVKQSIGCLRASHTHMVSS